ncbi:MAG: hypothetical protein RMX96_15495 [Nostoc sp. ChiSLP02]|nr:hypothetical protein [Nostoc sp. DedSLP05]MDZ8101811.1 hypothetical protein [Nostoc sp. DedSLP01]MDZ8186246.1 hypothetical protein [Nostoc sp. ChiSLP02]
MTCYYKAQQSTERGFRFLKDPLFFMSTSLESGLNYAVATTWDMKVVRTI